MPWTLYRYILKDLIRLMLISLAVMVLVISFAAAIKPLSEGLLDPWRLTLFVLLSIPTMLTIVAPFAAAFSSTMVFSRLASDNEVTACAASGISYRTIMLPVFVMGLVLTLTLYWLSNWIVPWFFQQTAMLVQKDITALVETQVSQGRAVELIDEQGLMLYADKAETRELPGGTNAAGQSEPYRLIMLRGAVLGQFDDETGQLGNHYAADGADVYLYRLEGRTWARMLLRRAAVYDPKTQNYLAAQDETLFGPFELPDPFRDDPRFLSWPQLKQLSAEPQRYSRVAERLSNLSEVVAREQVLRLIEGALSAGRADLLGGGDPPSQQYALSSPRVGRDGSTLRLSQQNDVPVRLRLNERNLAAFDVTAPEATVKTQMPARGDEPVIDVEMQDARVTYIPEDRGTQKREFLVRHAVWPQAVHAPLRKLAPGELLLLAKREYAGSQSVLSATDSLDRLLVKLRRQILAQVSERFALAFACLLVLMLGAVLSMKMRGAMPLVVYFWSFLLASLAVLITRSGENVATAPDYAVWVGPVMIWMGNAVLCLVIAGVYAMLTRN